VSHSAGGALGLPYLHEPIEIARTIHLDPNGGGCGHGIVSEGVEGCGPDAIPSAGSEPFRFPGRQPRVQPPGQPVSSSFSCRFRIFPLGLRGRGSRRISMRTGTLKAARRSATCSRSVCSVIRAPGRT
jgi:hypothetical protein